MLQWYLINYPILEGTKIRLEEQAVHYQQKFIATEDELHGSIRENESLRGRLHRLKTSLPTPSKVGVPGSMMEAEYRQNNAELKAKCAAMEAQRNRAVTAKEKAEEEKDQAVTARNKAQKAQEHNALNLATAVQSSSKKDDEIRDKSAELQVAKSTIEQLEARIKQLGEEKSTIEQLEARIKQLEEDMITLEGHKEGETAAIKAAQTTIDQLRHEKGQLEEANTTLNAEKSGLAETQKATKQQLDELEEKCRVEIAGLRSVITSKEGEVGNVQAASAKLNSEASNLRIERDNLQTSHGNLSKKCDELLGYVDRSHEQFHQGIQRLGLVGHVKDLPDMERVMHDWGHKMVHAEKQVHDLTQELHNLHETIKFMKETGNETPEQWKLRYEQKSAQYDEDMKKKQTDIRTIHQNYEDIKHELSKKIAEARKWFDQAKKFEHEKKSSSTINDLYQQQLRQRQEEIANLQGKIAGLQKERDGLQLDVTQLQDLKAKYEQEVQVLQEKRKLLEKQRSQLVKNMHKPATGPQSPGPNAEKRGHKSADEAEDEGSRSSKQLRQDYK